MNSCDLGHEIDGRRYRNTYEFVATPEDHIALKMRVSERVRSQVCDYSEPAVRTVKS